MAFGGLAMEATKHRTQISLDDWQYHLLMNESRRTKKSLSALIRDLITDKFAVKAGKTGNDPIFDVVGIGSSGHKRTAREHDAILYGKGQ
jgi:hypothetical protein